MSARCLPIEELESLLAASEDDPRRRHLRACPRCRAAWAEYRGFLQSPRVVEDPVLAADLARASQRLSGVIRSETGIDAADVTAPQPTPATVPCPTSATVPRPAQTTVPCSPQATVPRTAPSSALSGHADRLRAFWRAWRGPLWRPALAISGCALLGFGIAQITGDRDPMEMGGNTIELRSGQSSEPGGERRRAAAASFEPMYAGSVPAASSRSAAGSNASAPSVHGAPQDRRAAETTASSGPGEMVEPADTGGMLEFRWSPIDGSDAYQVILFSSDLAEQARWETDGPSLLLETHATPSLAQCRGCLWKVIALRDGEEIGESAAQPLPSPRE